MGSPGRPRPKGPEGYISTRVMGTFGDVYSCGVVLLKLLTGRKPDWCTGDEMNPSPILPSRPHSYVAPEYAMTGHLVVASDVYSCVVVLLALLTGREEASGHDPAPLELPLPSSPAPHLRVPPLNYVAPEYAMTGHLVVASDVYTYGVVLLKLLTGRKPYAMTGHLVVASDVYSYGVVLLELLTGREEARGHEYVAPEYAMTGHLVVASDVYSYGVVLLELLTGRKPVDMSQPPGDENLVTWARPRLGNAGRLDELLDPKIASQVRLSWIFLYHPSDLEQAAAVAQACVAAKPTDNEPSLNPLHTPGMRSQSHLYNAPPLPIAPPGSDMGGREGRSEERGRVERRGSVESWGSRERKGSMERAGSREREREREKEREGRPYSHHWQKDSPSHSHNHSHSQSKGDSDGRDNSERRVRSFQAGRSPLGVEMSAARGASLQDNSIEKDASSRDKKRGRNTGRNTDESARKGAGGRGKERESRHKDGHKDGEKETDRHGRDKAGGRKREREDEGEEGREKGRHKDGHRESGRDGREGKREEEKGRKRKEEKDRDRGEHGREGREKEERRVKEDRGKEEKGREEGERDERGRRGLGVWSPELWGTLGGDGLGAVVFAPPPTSPIPRLPLPLLFPHFPPLPLLLIRPLPRTRCYPSASSSRSLGTVGGCAVMLLFDRILSPILFPPPLPHQAIAKDEVLSKCKLIAEPWDCGGLYQVGSFPNWDR
ncbi:unnamed protein product [Closterium sp. NIES-54]